MYISPILKVTYLRGFFALQVECLSSSPTLQVNALQVALLDKQVALQVFLLCK